MSWCLCVDEFLGLETRKRRRHERRSPRAGGSQCSATAACKAARNCATSHVKNPIRAADGTITPNLCKLYTVLRPRRPINAPSAFRTLPYTSPHFECHGRPQFIPHYPSKGIFFSSSPPSPPGSDASIFSPSVSPSEGREESRHHSPASAKNVTKTKASRLRQRRSCLSSPSRHAAPRVRHRGQHLIHMSNRSHNVSQHSLPPLLPRRLPSDNPARLCYITPVPLHPPLLAVHNLLCLHVIPRGPPQPRRSRRVSRRRGNHF